MKNTVRRLLLACAALSALLGVAAMSAPPSQAAAAHLWYHRGYQIEGSWLCYGWANGAYHCTQHHNGFHSLNPSWVPNYGSAPAAKAAPITSTGHSPNTYPWGQCTWGAAAQSSFNVSGLGNAKDWLANARHRGLPTGSSPRVGATVVYQPGVQGASGLGHVAHVIAVYSNGSFLVREMNYYGFGGGFGRFSTRVSHTGWGVSFIY